MFLSLTRLRLYEELDWVLSLTNFAALLPNKETRILEISVGFSGKGHFTTSTNIQTPWLSSLCWCGFQLRSLISMQLEHQWRKDLGKKTKLETQLQNYYGDLVENLRAKAIIPWYSTKKSQPHYCYGLNVCIPSTFICWNSNPKLMVLGGRTFIRPVSVFTKKTQRALLPFPSCEVTVKRCHLWTRKWALTRHQTCWCLDHELSASKTERNKFLLLISHSNYRMGQK